MSLIEIIIVVTQDPSFCSEWVLPMGERGYDLIWEM